METKATTETKTKKRNPYNKFTAAPAVERILSQLSDADRAYVLAFVSKYQAAPAGNA
jgi:hypothetical protein